MLIEKKLAFRTLCYLARSPTINFYRKMSYTFRISQGFQWCQHRRYIAAIRNRSSFGIRLQYLYFLDGGKTCAILDISTGDQRIGNVDITGFDGV